MSEQTALKDQKEENLKRAMPLLARSKAATLVPTKCGHSYFYEIQSGWEARVMEKDDDISKALSSFDLEQAFMRTDIKRILIPRGANLAKELALKICERQPVGKTVYFERKNDER